MRTLLRTAAAFLAGAMLTALVFAFHPEPGEAIRRIAHPPPAEPERPDLYGIIRVKQDDGGFDHFLGPHVSIDLKDAAGYASHTGPNVRLLVDEEGKVVYAEARSGPKSLRERAERLARQVRFIPFRRNGEPVRAVIEEFNVDIREPGKRPNYRTPFPAIKNMATFEFRMASSGGWGNDAFEILVRGDGTINFESRSFDIAVLGKHKAQLSRQELQALIDALRSADWFWTPDVYETQATDQPFTMTVLRFDGRQKILGYSHGVYAELPNAILDAHSAILRVLNVDRWLKGNAETGPSLAAEKWNFKTDSLENRALLTGIAANGTSQALQDVWSLGAPVVTAFKPGPFEFPAPPIIAAAVRDDPQILDFLLMLDQPWDQRALNAALLAAANEGNVKAVDSLFARGADPRADDNGILMAAAKSGSREVMAAIIAKAASKEGWSYHAVFESTFDPDLTARAKAMEAAKRFITAPDKDGATALHALVDLWGRTEKPDARGVARLLIKHGAVIDARDNEGRTPLIKAGLWPEVASELISAGADVNAKDNTGETPLMNSYYAWLTRLLLERGADIHARNKHGHTALDRSKEYSRNESTPVLEWWLAKEKTQR